MGEIYEEIVRLKDEEFLSKAEMEKRLQLGRMIVANFPPNIFEQLSVWQPSVGCLNRCSFCSQEAGTQLRMLDGKSIRTIAGAFRYAAREWNIPSITYKRSYKPGILFPYLDNDIGSYPYLLDYLAAADSLNVRVRISTIGWSRKNKRLNKMHENIVQNYSRVLAGVRFSLTSYSSGWFTNRPEFVKDFINALQIYRPLIRLNDPEGNSGACIDIDFKPDIAACPIDRIEAGKWKVICGDSYNLVMDAKETLNAACDSYLVIGNMNVMQAVEMIENHIAAQTANHFPPACVMNGRTVLLKNEDGIYYGFYPKESGHVTDGIFFFPSSENRKGGIFNACWPLRELKDYIGKQDNLKTSYAKIRKMCQNFMVFEGHAQHRRKYLQESFFPMFSALCDIMEAVGFPAETLFDRMIVRDRGMIRNSGRAYYEFKRIASGSNIMVVPEPVLSQETNDEVWRIFPAKVTSASQAVNIMGRKSRVTDLKEEHAAENPDHQTYLVAWAVDPPSHSHSRRDGTIRGEYRIPITNFVTPLLSFDRAAGIAAGLVPGT